MINYDNFINNLKYIDELDKLITFQHYKFHNGIHHLNPNDIYHSYLVYVINGTNKIIHFENWYNIDMIEIFHQIKYKKYINNGINKIFLITDVIADGGESIKLFYGK